MRYFILAVLLATLPAVAQPSAILNSPDGRLRIAFLTVSNNQPAPAGRLVYTVSSQGRPILDPSSLQLNFKGQPPLGSDVRIVNASESQTDETYRPITGKTSSARNYYQALTLELEESGERARKFTIKARAYDDAVAFRYVVPKQPGLTEFRLEKEKTEFRISKDATTYALVLPHYRSMYESEFLKLPISAFSNQGGVASSSLLGLPLLMEIPGVAWVAIAEADLRDYAAMYLINPSRSWEGHWLECRLAPHVDDPETAVVGSLPHHSAW